MPKLFTCKHGGVYFYTQGSSGCGVAVEAVVSIVKQNVSLKLVAFDQRSSKLQLCNKTEKINPTNLFTILGARNPWIDKFYVV